MNNKNVFESSLKKLGLVYVNKKSIDAINGETYKPYIKALYLPKGYTLTVDFASYTTRQPTLFFVAPNQFLRIESGQESGYLIYYNRDFYCIQIHDQEVACDGLLFNNVQNMPMVTVPKEDTAFIDHLLHQMETEFKLFEHYFDVVGEHIEVVFAIRLIRLTESSERDADHAEASA